MNSRNERTNRIKQVAVVVALLGGVVGTRFSVHAHGLNGTCSLGQSGSFMHDENLVVNPDLVTPQFAIFGGRWNVTATDGIVDPGEAITLTYSFVPDGTHIAQSQGEPAESNLFATLDTNFPGGRAAWKAVFADAFARWSEHTNISYVEVSDDGEQLGTTIYVTPQSEPIGPGAPGELGKRGDIRIGMHFINGTLLAYNHFPGFGGDMVFDSADVDVLTDPTNNFRAFRNIIMHEHGHGLGIGHVVPTSGSKLMEPSLSTAFDGAQEDDIRAAQHIYGDRLEPNDDPESYSFIGALEHPSVGGELEFVIEDVALEQEESEDWYAFTLPGSLAGLARIAVRVEPVGNVYSFAPDDGSTPQSIDASAVRDLGFELYRRTNSQTNEMSLIADIDLKEAGDDEYLPPSFSQLGGLFYIRVYSNDGENTSQRYQLILSNAAIAGGSPSFALFNGANEVQDGQVVGTLFGSMAVNTSVTRSMSIQNQGDGPLLFTSVQLSGGSADDCSASINVNQLAPGNVAPAELTITCEPSNAGPVNLVVSIPTNDPQANPFEFVVSALAVAPQEPGLAMYINGTLTPDETEVDLGEYPVGITQTAEIELINDGDETISITNAVAQTLGTLDATVEGELPGTLAPGASLVYTLHFTLSAEEEQSTRVVVFSTDVDGAYVVDVAATGFEQELGDDCNENGVEDAVDLTQGVSVDCNLNGTPDECETDTDADGVIDGCDECPGQNDQQDSDGDNTPDCKDNCPNTSNEDQLDSNGDGTGDACSEEVEDCNGNGLDDGVEIANGIADDCDGDNTPDICESDEDADGIIDDCDQCPGAPDHDSDQDGWLDCEDNCPVLANPAQIDNDGNGIGDLCEQEEDVNPVDDCNGNGLQDAIDIALGESSDCDSNRVPDECEEDRDGDGVIDACDQCKGTDDNADRDEDGVVDCLDNCPSTRNSDQRDDDLNGIGDACEIKEQVDQGEMFCGAGSIAMMPLMALGWLGNRCRRRANV